MDPTGKQVVIPVPGRMPVLGYPTPNNQDGNGLDDATEIQAQQLESSSYPVLVTIIGDVTLNRCKFFCRFLVDLGLKSEQTPEERRVASKPTNAPKGTRAIDKAGIDKDGVHEIKDGIGAKPKDWVGITPDGGIITTDPETGEAVDQGNIIDYDIEREQPRY
jgi:hypothetical protein